MAHKWAHWLRHPCPMKPPYRFEVAAKSEWAQKNGKLAMWPLPYGRSPMLQNGRQTEKWPRIGEIGYVTLAVCGHDAPAQGTK